MELAFRTRWLRDVCEDPRRAAAEYGDRTAGALQARLADLHAAGSASDLVAGAPRVGGPAQSRLVIQIANSQYLVLQCNHVKSIDGDGPVDWSKVTRLQVVSIGEDTSDED